MAVSVALIPAYVAIIGLVATAVSLLVVLLFVRTITSRLQSLVEASDRLSKGDFDHSVTQSGRDEIGHLAEAFEDKFARNALRYPADEVRGSAEKR